MIAAGSASAPELSPSTHPAKVGPRIGPAAQPGSVGSYETQGSSSPASKGGSSSGAIIGGSIGGKLWPCSLDSRSPSLSLPICKHTYVIQYKKWNPFCIQLKSHLPFSPKNLQNA